MSKLFKRGMSLLLAIVMAISILPMNAMAADGVVGQDYTTTTGAAPTDVTPPTGTHWVQKGTETLSCEKMIHEHEDSCFTKELKADCGHNHTHGESCFSSSSVCVSTLTCTHTYHYTKQSTFLGRPVTTTYGASEDALTCSVHTDACYASTGNINKATCPTVSISNVNGYEHKAHTVADGCYTFTWQLAYDEYNVTVTVTGKDGVVASDVPTKVTYGQDVVFNLPAIDDAYNTWTATVGTSVYTLSKTAPTQVTVENVTSQAAANISVSLSSEPVDTYSVTLSEVGYFNGCSAKFDVEQTANLLPGAKLTLNVTVPTSTTSAKYGYEADVSGDGASIDGNVVTVGNGDVTVTVTYNKEELTANSNASAKFNPYSGISAVDMMGASAKYYADVKDKQCLEQEIVEALGLKYNGELVDWKDVDIKYLPYVELKPLFGVGGTTVEYASAVALSVQPGDDEDGYNRRDRHYFGERFAEGGKEKIVVTYKGLSLETEISLTEGRQAPVIAMGALNADYNDFAAFKTAVENAVTIKNAEGTDVKASAGMQVVYSPADTFPGTYSITVKAATDGATWTTGEKTFNNISVATTTYKIIFKNWDGEVLSESDVAYGIVPAYSGTPVKAGNAEFTYTFTGWDTTPVAVTGAATYTAQFGETKNVYTVTWEGVDSEQVEYGEAPTKNPTVPTKTATAEWSYTNGVWTTNDANWDSATGTIKGNVTFKPSYTEVKRKYTVNWVVNNVVVKTEDLDYGEVPSNTVADYSENGVDYTFVGWDKDGDKKADALTAVVGPASYVAVFTTAKSVYSVVYKDGENTLTTQTVAHGELALGYTVPTEKIPAGYRFDCWMLNGAEYNFATPVVGVLTLTAKWQKIWTVTFKDGTSVVKEMSLDDGALLTNVTFPSVSDTNTDGKVFLGWSVPEGVTAVTKDVVITASWGTDSDNDGYEDGSTNDPFYNVVFKNENNVVVESYNNILNASRDGSTYGVSTGDTNTDGRVFTGWVLSENGTALTFTAAWSDDKNNNGVADANETAKVKLNVVDNGKAVLTNNGNDKIIITGEGTYTVVFDSTDAASGNKVVVSATSNDTVATDGNLTVLDEANSTLELNLVDSDEIVNVPVKFITYTLNASDGTIYINGYIMNAGDKLDGLKNKVLTASGLWAAGGNYTVYMVTGSGTYDVESSNFLEQTSMSARLNVGDSQGFIIKDNTTGVSKQVTIKVEEDRKPAVIGDLTYTTTNFDTEDQFKSAVETAIKANITDASGNAVTPNVTFDYAKNGDGTYNVTANVVAGSTWEATSRTFNNVAWTVNKYAVTWVDGNEATIYSENIEYGKTPVYTGATPTKATTAQYTYTFNNTWSPSIASVSGTVTYTAQFDATVNKYTVTWLDGDGNTIYSEDVEYGTVPAFDETKNGKPTKTSNDPQSVHTWDGGWETEVVAVTKAVSYKATFTPDKIYLVTFNNEHGETTYGYVNASKGETTLGTVADPTDVDNYIFDDWYVVNTNDVFDGSTVVNAPITVEARWIADKNNNNELDDTETATVKVTVTGNGKVSLTNATGKTTITDNKDGTYTVFYDKTVAASKEITVVATPDNTGVNSKKNYVVSATESVTVENGEVSEVTAVFAEHSIPATTNEKKISVNGFSADTKFDAVTKKAVLEAVLGKTLSGNEMSLFDVKVNVNVAALRVNGYVDVWELAAPYIGKTDDFSLGMLSAIKSAFNTAIDVGGTEKFEVTYKAHGIYPEVIEEFDVKLVESRDKTTAVHNGDTYKASELKDNTALLDEIKADITTNTTIESIKFADDSITLVPGTTYDNIKVIVTVAETNEYYGKQHNVTVTVTAPVKKASIEIAATANMTYNTGMTDANKVAMVLAAVNPQYSPELPSDVKPTVWYKASEARLVDMTINLGQMDLGLASNFLPDTAEIQIPVEDMWLNIGDDLTIPEAPSNDRIKEILLNDLIPNYGTQYISGQLTNDQMMDILASTLQKYPDISEYYKYLGAHQFGENETKDENGNVLEIVYISVPDYGYGAAQSKTSTLTLADLRAESSIKLNTGVIVTYNGYTEKELLTALVDGVYAPDGTKINDATVTFVTDVVGLPASEASEIIVKFAGNKDYKGSTATGTIVINKANVTVSVDNQMVKYGEKINTLPVTTNPAGVDNIQFIVGLDVSEVNINEGIKGIKGNVQLLLPAELQSLLEMAGSAINAATGLDLSFADGASMKLSELQGAVDAMDDIFAGSDYEEYFNVLLKMVGSLPTDVADVEIIIGGNLPTTVGAYVIGAVTADSNYNTAFGVGVLVIYPDGIRAELDWKMKDDNSIITRSLLTTKGDDGAYLFDTSAYATSVGEGGTVEEATAQAYEVFLGVDIDGNITLETDQTKLEVGAYTEIAMIANWGNVMYYSAPIARAFVVIAETLEVDFLDENGNVNNERFYTFDNTAKSGMEGKDKLSVTYKQDGEGYKAGDKVSDYNVKYYYVGVQTNGKPYASTTAPVHAGAYTITAIVTVRDGEGTITHAGQGIGAIVIEPAQSDVAVNNAMYQFDNKEHGVNDLVHATSVVPNITPETTVISAGVKLNRNSSFSGLDAVEGTVNVDMPAWMDEVLKKLGIMEAAYTDTGITVDVFSSYTAQIRDALESLGIESDAFDKVADVIGQIPNEVRLTFHDDKTYSDVGAYLVLAVVTDSDHYPSAGAGIMLIYPDATKVELKFEEDWNGNNIFTWNALQSINLDAQAYNLGTDTVNSEADALVTNIYLGFNDDGKVVLTNDKSTLDNGLYTQLAFLVDLGTEMYYAEPISRAFMIVPNPVTITFVDDSGNENKDRIFTFDNTPHSMNVVVKDANGKVIDDDDGVTITYTGIQNNLKAYNSTEAPVHAGSYAVTATYTARDDKDRLVTLGVEIGAMVIKPAASDIDISSAAIPYDGKAHSINEMVKASSAVENITPDSTIITASINTDGSFSENMLDAIEGSINVDVPAWVDAILADYDNVKNGVSVAGFVSAINEIKANLSDMGIKTDVFDELLSVMEQLPADLTVTFDDNAERTAVGIYLVIGAVTDSDHIPSMDVGYLVIYPDVVKTELKFNSIDANGIFTKDLMENFDFSATAYGKADGAKIDAATEQIQYLYFGVDNDGKLVLKGGLNAVKALPYGVYTELAFIAEINSVIYLAEPIIRPVISVPNTVDVDFDDVQTRYNGKPQGIGSVNVTKANDASFVYAESALSVYYAGISSNGAAYWSEEAPVHAGVYSVIATYVDGENVGAHIGSLTILPAEASIEIPSKAVKYGTNYDIPVTVIPEDDSINPKDAKYLLMIAGTDTTESNGKLSLTSINTINLDFPTAVDNVLAKLGVENGVTIGDFTKLTDGIQSALDLIGYEDGYMTKVVKLLDQMDDGVVVTFNDNYKPSNVGMYFMIATIFDPDYMPAVDTAALVIYPDGKLVDIEFTTQIPGALNIMPYNTVVDFDFGATTNGGAQVDSILENVIFGVTTDAKLFVGDGNAANYAGNPNEIGAYTQVAYLPVDLNLIDSNEFYVAVPEFRIFSVVKSDYDVIFVEDESADTLVENNDRIFTYNGEAHSMPAVIVDAFGNKLGYVPTVYYIGVDTTLDATWSTTAPSNAGVYKTVAYYFNEEENIYTMATGIMAIEKGINRFGLLDTVTPYDGNEKWPDMINDNGADYFAVVVGGSGEDLSVNLLLEDDIEAIRTVLELALNKDLDSKKFTEIRESIKAEALKAAVDKVLDTYTLPAFATEALTLFKNELDNVPDTVTVTINGTKPVEVGTYKTYAISCSANYKAEISQGVLTIKPIYVVINDVAASKHIGAADPTLTAEVSYYSYKGGEVVEKNPGDGTTYVETEKVVINTLPSEIELTYDVVREQGEEVGNYAMSVENASISDTKNFVVEVVEDDTVFTIEGHTDANPADHKCDICGEPTSLCVDNDNNHKCDACDETISLCVDSDNNHKCDICDEAISLCADNDNNHKCDICGTAISLCADNDNNHKCDICGETMSLCVDNDGDHACDICGEIISLCNCEDADNDHQCDNCGETVSLCEDNDSDHKCDTCGETMSLCVDNDGDHACDICGEIISLCNCVDNDDDHQCDNCGETVSLCEDNDSDHKCDTCGATISLCADNDNNHKCDFCGETMSLCVDNDGDHVCDICGEIISLCECEDINGDHACDNCGNTISLCEDNDDDHVCDTCGETISLCVDSDGDHACDICGEIISLCNCVDNDDDHQCDNCGEWMSVCEDNDDDHLCDICGDTISLCVDNDNDHKCDICGVAMSLCADNDNNHKCDICGETMSLCADNDGDHVCDICGEIISLCNCVDADNDHKCDNCGDTMSLCADNDNDHKCDTCGETISLCADNDGDHKCDICGEIISLCNCVDADNDHKCDNCGDTMSACADSNNDHKCDTCGTAISLCVDNDNNHKCDICGVAISLCADNDNDHKCDICGETMSLCVDNDGDHKCDICGQVISLCNCVDNDKNHKCDNCGETMSACADSNSDHKCDTCGTAISLCVDNDNNHKCDICGTTMSLCADNDKNHKCDTCGTAISLCVDNDGDHKCDICGQVISVCNCVDNDKNHKCDICGETISLCTDNNKDHKCDTCGTAISVCVDNNKDHKCDICGTVISQCTDSDRNNYCDTCSKYLGGGGGGMYIPGKKPTTEDKEPDNKDEHACEAGDNCMGKVFNDTRIIFNQNPNIWYHEAVDYVYIEGLMNGMANNRFEPSITTSRAMIVVTLYRMENSPEVNGDSIFTDVENGVWYTDAIVWATENGIVNGYGNGKFGPSDAVTREQIAAIFHRYADYKGMDVSEKAELTDYVDVDDISAWALDSMKWANAIGLMEGRSESTINPLEDTMRSELAMLLMRWCEEIAK